MVIKTDLTVLVLYQSSQVDGILYTIYNTQKLLYIRAFSVGDNNKVLKLYVLKRSLGQTSKILFILMRYFLDFKSSYNLLITLIFHIITIIVYNTLEIKNKYNKTCLIQTRNKQESCINQTLN